MNTTSSIYHQVDQPPDRPSIYIYKEQKSVCVSVARYRENRLLAGSDILATPPYRYLGEFLATFFIDFCIDFFVS